MLRVILLRILFIIQELWWSIVSVILMLISGLLICPLLTFFLIHRKELYLISTGMLIPIIVIQLLISPLIFFVVIPCIKRWWNALILTINHRFGNILFLSFLLRNKNLIVISHIGRIDVIESGMYRGVHRGFTMSLEQHQKFVSEVWQNICLEFNKNTTYDDIKKIAFKLGIRIQNNFDSRPSDINYEYLKPETNKSAQKEENINKSEVTKNNNPINNNENPIPSPKNERQIDI